MKMHVGMLRQPGVVFFVRAIIVKDRVDLHHPPCESLTANRMFYALAALAYNLMAAVKLLCLPDECQSWMVATLLRQMVRLPAVLVHHARRLVARVEVPPAWITWWQNWEQRWWPPVAAGRPSG